MKKIILFILFLIMFFVQGCSCNHDLVLDNCKKEPTLETSGFGVLKCSKCGYKEEAEFPILNQKDYSFSSVKATCYQVGKGIYSSKKYGKYEIDIPKTSHLTYGGFCYECEQTINNLNFNPENFVQISGNGGYPRLYVLDDGTWLCGYDTGKISVTRSTDGGQTWSKPVIASVHDDYACANVAFFQLSNGDILCAYRAIGSDKREIQCTISTDGGLTWKFHSTIEDNFQTAIDLGYTEDDAKKAINSEGRIGFFEPHFGIINDKLTVMYADDFTTMLTNPRGNTTLNYETQYIVSRSWDESSKTWSKRNIVLDGTIQKTVSGITEFSRDGMPVFDKLSDGTYVLVVEGTYRRNSQNGSNPFIILLSYSKDGINWSTPVEVYVPKGVGTKASAPYVCVTSDDRIIISFQTDEDSFKYGKGRGDNVSIMKTIISDGTPVEKITKESFSESVNVFGLKPGDLSSWNGMYIHNDILYCVSGVRGKNELLGSSLSGVYMASSTIPTIEEVGTYADTQSEIKYSYEAIVGDIVCLNSGWFKTTKDSTMVVFNDKKLDNGIYSVEVMLNYISLPQINSEINFGGIIFKYSSNKDYYGLLIDHEGSLLLGKMSNGKWSILHKCGDLMEDYSRLNRYDLEVHYNDGYIECYVNSELLFDYTDDNPLQGNQVGIMCKKRNTLFNNLRVE